MKNKHDLHPARSNVFSSMLDATGFVFIALACIAGISGMAALLDWISSCIPPILDEWTGIITRDLTSVSPAIWIVWGSVLSAAWCGSVAYSLGIARLKAFLVFALASATLILFVAAPAVSALWSVLGEQPAAGISDETFLDAAAGFTAMFTTAMCFVAPIWLYLLVGVAHRDMR